MGYQFAHVNTYSRSAAKGSGSGWSAQDIADEAERKPSACHHVEEPQAPTLLYGVMPSTAVKRAEAWAKQAKDRIGRKLRADGLCIVAGVVSVPEGFSEWNDYKKSAIEYLKEKHGERLLSVVEHTDEEFPHFHFYVVPKDGETMEDIHEGLKARNEKREEKKITSEQNIAYQEAMTQFQDLFYKNVAERFGLLRDGPKRERLSRAEYKAKKAAAELAAKMMEEAHEKAQEMIIEAMSKVEDKGADYIARVKASAKEFIDKTKADCEEMKKSAMAAAKKEASTIKATAKKAGRAEAAAKYGGIAGVFTASKEISKEEAQATVLEANDDLVKRVHSAESVAKRHYEAAQTERQRASVAEQSAKLAREDAEKAKAHATALQKQLDDLKNPKHTGKQQDHRQDDTHAPKI